MRTINEKRYIQLVSDVITQGYLSESRAGDTYSLPSQHITVDLRLGFPLLTTRKMFPAGVLGELAAFVRGAEDLATFEKYGCNYWKDNAANWLPNKGLPESEWHVGRIYGAVWRDLNGVDQLANVIENIKEDPYSRRHVVSAWDGVCDGALPPCHIMFQFYVRQGFLHCHVYMRSVDLCVGLPSDILLYGVLMSLAAKDTGLKPATLTFSFGDAHVYKNHIEQFTQEQVKRKIHGGPVLLLDANTTTLTFEPQHATFEGYVHGEVIKYAFNA